MEDQSTPKEFPDVQGNIPVVRFEMNEAYKYMVQVLGRKERIPRRFSNIKEGAIEILMCLKLRYGEGHSGDITSLLAWQLTICKDDQEIWGDWREKFTARSDVVQLVQESRLEQRILAWNDGSDSYKAGTEAPARIAAARRTPIFTSDNEFESRVDNLNGSRVARDLAEVTESGRGLLRGFSSYSDVVPWEPQGIKASLGKMKETVGKVFDKAQQKRS